MSKSSGVALVTGSATGIGRAAVLSFARRGYDVAVNYSRSEAEAHETAELARKIGVKALVPFKIVFVMVAWSAATSGATLFTTSSKVALVAAPSLSVAVIVIV